MTQHIFNTFLLLKRVFIFQRFNYSAYQNFVMLPPVLMTYSGRDPPEQEVR